MGTFDIQLFFETKVKKFGIKKIWELKGLWANQLDFGIDND